MKIGEPMRDVAIIGCAMTKFGRADTKGRSN